jgi:hypothetical protein
VIDDEPQILRALRINLSVRGYEVPPATSTDVALGPFSVLDGLALGLPLERGYHPWVLDRFHDLTEQAGLPRVRLHDLRHPAASFTCALAR